MRSTRRRPLRDRKRGAGFACTSLSGAVLLTMLAASAQAAGLPWEIWESPSRLATLDPADIVLERSSHCLDGCRYDRSNAGPEDPADNPYPERWLYRVGGEAVVFDERGPGAVTRIWLTTGFGVPSCIDPAIRVRFYLDGAATPELDVPLAALFDGSTLPFTPPLVADRSQASGGYFSYVPIAYAQSLRIALIGADNGGTNPCTGDDHRLLWFQIQHHRVAPVTPMAGQDFPAWRAFLSHAGDDPWNGMLTPQSASSTLAPGATLDLATHSGPAWLRGIRLQLPRSAYADVRVRLAFDDVITVDAPLADFFATAPDAMLPARGVLAGEDAGGWLYAWLPMPFAQSASVELVADPNLPAAIVVDSAISFEDAPVAENAGLFTATLADSCLAGGDLALYAHSGAGKVVGLSARYHADSVVDLGYLEGDERAYVDGAIAPSWYGTGIEDFYNAGFYFAGGEVALALSGATEVDPDGGGVTAAYRWMLGDPLGYSSALRLTQEAGLAPTQPVPTCARTLVHAYRADRASIVAYDRFEVGDASAMAHAYLPPADASCTPFGGTFEDEPPTARNADVCTYTGGSSHFRFHVVAGVPPLRLRRTFIANLGIPGEIAGAPAAEVRVNGVVAGWFPPAIANPVRAWQQQEVLLDSGVNADTLNIEIVPEFAAHAAGFSESAYELRGGWKDSIFADGFEPALPLATN